MKPWEELERIKAPTARERLRDAALDLARALSMTAPGQPQGAAECKSEKRVAGDVLVLADGTVRRKDRRSFAESWHEIVVQRSPYPEEDRRIVRAWRVRLDCAGHLGKSWDEGPWVYVEVSREEIKLT